jgi:hypothetical protein
MTTPRRWHNAEEAAVELAKRPSDRRTLLLLARLPLLPERVLERLAGVSGGASVYRTLRRLADAGLVAAIRPPIQTGNSPRLWYLTDLGLAVVALDQGVAVEHLARHNRLRGADLLALLPGLPHLLARYDLLAAVATFRPGRPDLLAWERPWRRRCQRPTAKRPLIVTLPAYAALSWDGETGTYLLLPDLATYPLRHYQATLDRLFVLRRHRAGDLPPVVVVTGDPGRAAAWQGLIEATRQQRAEDPLAACVATWTNLHAALETLMSPSGVAGPPIEQVVQRVRLPPGQHRRPAALLPRLIGDDLTGRAAQPHTSQSLGRIALGLTVTDRMLLDFVGRHPFLTLDRLAVMGGWSVASVRRRRNRLVTLGLMRLLATDEIDQEIAALELVELTAEGLTLCAAQQGLSLAAAVRVNGLAGGGPKQPIGTRRMLRAQLAHTLGADGIFISLMRTSRHRAAAGCGDGLVEWQNAAACSRRHLRPDGYGIYRHRGHLYGFFLEYDRGTMSTRDYRRKFAAYYDYWTSGRFARDYDGFPTILVVTIDSVAEERIASAARTASVGHAGTPPVLLTCRWRIDDPRNADGLLGPIWREPDADFRVRRRWPSRPTGIPSTSLGGKHPS